jgi:hypothetical protein
MVRRGQTQDEADKLIREGRGSRRNPARSSKSGRRRPSALPALSSRPSNASAVIPMKPPPAPAPAKPAPAAAKPVQTKAPAPKKPAAAAKKAAPAKGAVKRPAVAKASAKPTKKK